MMERINPQATAAHARVALFDFDGTISTIRSGWVEVMVPMMVEILTGLKTGEREADLRLVVEEFVGRLTGKQTMYQMIALCDEIKKRGGTPKEPLAYKHQYLTLLWDKIKHRVEALESGAAKPVDYVVPGSFELLETLKERGLKMYLASGTDEAYMKREAELLGVTKYFEGGVFGALDDYKAFSKAILIQQIIEKMGYGGDEILGFGDGYVEIENVKKVGGTTVGVASDEPSCIQIDEWKRKRLIGVGADYIVPNFLDRQTLFSWLFPA